MREPSFWLDYDLFQHDLTPAGKSVFQPWRLQISYSHNSTLPAITG